MRSGVDEIKQAWQKCHDLWVAAGKPLPYLAPEYLKAREELASLIKEARGKALCAPE